MLRHHRWWWCWDVAKYYWYILVLCKCVVVLGKWAQPGRQAMAIAGWVQDYLQGLGAQTPQVNPERVQSSSPQVMWRDGRNSDVRLQEPVTVTLPLDCHWGPRRPATGESPQVRTCRRFGTDWVAPSVFLIGLIWARRHLSWSIFPLLDGGEWL